MLPVDAICWWRRATRCKAGDVLGKLPRATTKTKDITGGLPRVAELFEVRKPKETAVLSEIDGYVAISKAATKKGKQKVTITPVDVGEKREYLIPKGKHINVIDGDYVRAGEPLIGGAAVPQDILNIKGEVSLAKLPGQRSAGGLSPPGRPHQRQAHRGDRTSDDAPGEDSGRRRYRFH
jgi:DNA-directed RNA polymerase subunit beta'